MSSTQRQPLVAKKPCIRFLFGRNDRSDIPVGAWPLQSSVSNKEAAMTRLSSVAVETVLLREFRATSDADIPDTGLTARESEILALMATGLTNPQIAEQLVIGLGTVKTHTLNIYRKLDVANRSQAIVRAQQLGLIPHQHIK